MHRLALATCAAIAALPFEFGDALAQSTPVPNLLSIALS